MAVATYSDVGVALGRTISDSAEQDQITWWLDGIELLIRSRLGDVADLDQDVLKYVEVEAVVGKVQRAGRDESSLTVSVDDASVTRRYENSVGLGDITDEWWNLLNPNSNTGTASIRPLFDTDTARWPVSTPPCYPYSDVDGYWTFP